VDAHAQLSNVRAMLECVSSMDRRCAEDRRSKARVMVDELASPPLYIRSRSPKEPFECVYSFHNYDSFSGRSYGVTAGASAGFTTVSSGILRSSAPGQPSKGLTPIEPGCTYRGRSLTASLNPRLLPPRFLR
jgi:hypothetical protein